MRRVWLTMRVLFSTTGSAGHLGPLLPFAGALRDAGHAVRIATQRARRENVARAGFEPASFDDPPEAAWLAARAGLEELDAEKAGERMADVFAGVNPRAALPGVLATLDAWAPDLVIVEPAEPAAALAAELRGIPVACVSFALAETGAWFLPFLAPAVDVLRSELGLPPDPTGERIRSTPTLTATPPALDPLVAEPRPHRYRTTGDSDRPPLPDWWPGNREPLVYVTFGSVAGGVGLFPALYRAAIDALAPLGGASSSRPATTPIRPRSAHFPPTSTLSAGSRRTRSFPSRPRWSVTAATAPRWAPYPMACRRPSCRFSPLTSGSTAAA